MMMGCMAETQAPLDRGTMSNDGVSARLRWPVVVWSSDGSVARDKLLRATSWWERQLEEHIGCETEDAHVLCMPGIQLFYTNDTSGCIGDDPYVYSGEGAWVDVRVDDIEPWRLGVAKGWWRHDNGCPVRAEVIMSRGLLSRDFDNVLAHELGHVLGLEHDSNSLVLDSVMKEIYSGSRGHVTGSDASLILDQISSGDFCRN